MLPFDPMRHERQARFAPLGPDGQAKIAASRVAIVGCGALGSVVADVLARAGVGALRLIDRDVVDVTNLHRVALFDEADAADALPKAAALARHLARVHSAMEVDPVVTDLDGANAVELLAGSDLVVDGTDNFEARHVVNEACLQLEMPWIHGACLGSVAVTWPILPGGPCFSCLVPDVPAPGEVPTCATAGILGPTVHAAAALQATEALKILAGRRDDVLPGPWTLDAWKGTSARVRAERDPACAACGQRRFRFLGRRRETTVACGRTAVQVRVAAAEGHVDLVQLAERLRGRVDVRSNRFLVRFLAGGNDVTVFRDGRVLVSGTRDPGHARAVVSRYLGG